MSGVSFESMNARAMRPAMPRRIDRRVRSRFHLHALAVPGRAFDDDLFAGVESGDDLHRAIVTPAGLHDAKLRAAVLTRR